MFGLIQSNRYITHKLYYQLIKYCFETNIVL